jgi:hypothetical protein
MQYVLIGVGSRRRSANQVIDLPSDGGGNLGRLFTAMTAGSALWGQLAAMLGPARSVLHRVSRRYPRDRADLAPEAPVRCGRGSRTIDATAGAGLGHRRGCRSRSGV